jgi:hypothetical protein
MSNDILTMSADVKIQMECFFWFSDVTRDSEKQKKAAKWKIIWYQK